MDNHDKQEGPVSRKALHTIVKGSFAGALLEWYDFFIFGTAASILFGPLFFPTDDPIFGIMASFAVFGAGFLARPLGGLVFGHYGDKVGRKVTLLWTLSIVGLSTFLIGLIPTYDSVGILAPILLVILRLIQGFGLGGEYGGAALIAIEAAPAHHRGFVGSLPQVAASAGIMLATGVYWLLNTLLTPEQVLAWGWRIPFLISAAMALIGLYIRTNSVETLNLAEDEAQKTQAHTVQPEPNAAPVVALFKDNSVNIVLAFGARLAETISSNIINAFTISYVAVQLAMGSEIPLHAMLVASAFGMCMCPVVGWLSDKFSQSTMYKMGSLFLVLAMFPFFMLVNTQDAIFITLAMVLAYNFGPTFMFAVQPTMFARLFPPRQRYSGLSVAYQFSAILGGMTPLICTFLLKEGNGEPWLVAGYVVAIAAISFISTVLLEKRNKNLKSKEF